MSVVDLGYYALWLVGLAAVGGVLLLVSSKGAVHVLITALEVLVSWAVALGLSLLPI